MVDSQASPAPALDVLASPEIDVVTLTVTEKGYCHKPSSGELDLDHPDIVHDLANPEAPRSLPGLIARALELRMNSHGRPVTLMSCDNIPANGVILANVVNAIANGADAASPNGSPPTPPSRRAWWTASRRRRRRPTSTWSSRASATATARSSSASRSANG